MLDISVIILTFNEKLHIERCILNAKRFAKEIFVVDSFSTDNTAEMAERLGAKVYRHPWENYSRQFAWALENLPIKTAWVWRMDADEWLTDELIDELHRTLPDTPEEVNGYTVQCLRKFMGRHIRHGILPLVLLRLFRPRYASIENKMMDEHIKLSEGRIEALKCPFFDDNLNDLTWWTQKHNGYATREAIDLLCTAYGIGEDVGVGNTGDNAAKTRARKLKYTKMPLFWRAFAFFFLRYFLRGGFLDGKEGFLWHFLQGFWYRVLADAKVFEFKKRYGWEDERIKTAIAAMVSSNPQMGGVEWHRTTILPLPLLSERRWQYAA